jgi:hypothetical protein
MELRMQLYADSFANVRCTATRSTSKNRDKLKQWKLEIVIAIIQNIKYFNI